MMIVRLSKIVFVTNKQMFESLAAYHLHLKVLQRKYRHSESAFLSIYNSLFKIRDEFEFLSRTKKYRLQKYILSH